MGFKQIVLYSYCITFRFFFFNLGLIYIKFKVCGIFPPNKDILKE